MDPRLCILLITVEDDYAQALQEAAGDGVEVSRAARAAEAVRRFDAQSPDAVVIGIDAQPEQVALLLQALRDRPLGALVPLALIDRGQSAPHPLTTPTGAAEAGADRYFAPGTPATVVLASLAGMLGVELDLPTLVPSAAPPTQAPAIVVRAPEPASEATPRHHAPPPLSAPSSGISAPLPRPEAVTPEVIRRKKRQARHEDYFSLLDLRKSADERLIQEAYQRLRGRFEPSRLPQPLADRHFADLHEICDALDDAFAVLADPEQRDAYLRALLQTPATQ